MSKEVIISFCISIIPFMRYYVKSFDLLEYYGNIRKSNIIKYATIFTFSFVGVLICMTFIDVLTLSYDKEWLEMKEKIGIATLGLFEVVIMVIAPLMYVYYKKKKIEGNFGLCVEEKMLGVYYGSVIIGNVYNGVYSNNRLISNYGFSNVVPEGLAKYAMIDNWVYQVVYFNFGILMSVGKFISFTYMPHGMSQWVSQFLFDNSTEFSHLSNETMPNQSYNPTNKKHFLFLENNDDDDEEYVSLTLESNTPTFPSSYDNSINSKISLGTYIVGLFSLGLILMIIYSKLSIIYVKIFYSICGIDCGLLAYRYDEIFSLETLISYSSLISNEYIRYDYLIFAYLLFFRMLALIYSIKLKGISFLWIIYTKPRNDIHLNQLIHLLSIIIFASIVLIYDFTYLLPDYMRFNGLDQICDYSIIHKSYCGVSFFGLLFIKISMNYPLFIYWDIIASLIFITTSMIWVYRLIFIPFIKKMFN